MSTNYNYSRYVHSNMPDPREGYDIICYTYVSGGQKQQDYYYQPIPADRQLLESIQPNEQEQVPPL